MSGPAAVSIMRQGRHLIASVHTALDDSQLAGFQCDLIPASASSAPAW